MPPPKSGPTAPKSERNREIITRYLYGERIYVIARDHGLSPQRVHQMLVNAGVWKRRNKRCPPRS